MPAQAATTYSPRVLVLLGIAFLAGVITAISPCVLPVLPIILAGSAASTDRRRPYAIVLGLVVSFTTFTLAGAALLSALGLPEDLLRNIAIVALLVLAASLLSQRVAWALERPFLFLTILHQALDRYADHLSPGRRAEWAKVQGRFMDIAFVTAIDETIALIGRALASTPAEAEPMRDAFEWLKRQGFRGRMVFLTGHARTDPLVARAWNERAAPVFQKPMTVEELGAIVEGERP